MNNNTQKVPTYGAMVSSIEYDERLRRRDWLRHHRNKLIIGFVALAAVAAVVLSYVIMA